MTKRYEGLFKLVASGIKVASENPKNATNKSFKEGFSHRDPGIDFLIRDGISKPLETGSCYEVIEEGGANFLEMARGILGVGDNIPEKYLAPLLIECGKTFLLFQIEDLKNRFVDGEREIGLNEDGPANIFFAHGLAYGGPGKDLAVIEIYPTSEGWRMDARKLNGKGGRTKGCKLFLPN